MPWADTGELRLRDNGDGTWSIVRVEWGLQFGVEVVAKGLTRSVAERMIKLSKEE